LRRHEALGDTPDMNLNIVGDAGERVIIILYGCEGLPSIDSSPIGCHLDIKDVVVALKKRPEWDEQA